MSEELKDLRAQWIAYVLAEAESRITLDRERLRAAGAVIDQYPEAKRAYMDAEEILNRHAADWAEAAYLLGLEHGRDPGAVVARLTGASSAIEKGVEDGQKQGS